VLPDPVTWNSVVGLLPVPFWTTKPLVPVLLSQLMQT